MCPKKCQTKVNVAHNELNERASWRILSGVHSLPPDKGSRLSRGVVGVGRGANSFVAEGKVRLTNCQATHFAVFIFILPAAMQGAEVERRGRGWESVEKTRN